MSDKLNDGGPAFPCTKSVTATCPDSGRVQETYTIPHGGMSLRDWFAGQAMAAIGNACYERYSHMAQDAYEIADAMLAARKAKAEGDAT
jgi:hypothetical protein